jgi:acetyltransferase-like isoleucine patch superfamily enzyme
MRGMNSLQRGWLTWKHRRKFARLGRGCVYPIPDLTIAGHVEQGDYGRFRNNATLRTYGAGKIVFATRAGAAWGCLFEAHELIEIGEYTALAEYTYVTDSLLHLAGHAGPWRDAPRTTRPVRIGSGVFVGSGCYIGPGVSIGDGAVIANHSVLTRSVGPLEIWAGAPARRIGHRTQVSEAQQRAFEAAVAKYGIQSDRYEDG